MAVPAFTERDVTKAIVGATKTGLTPTRVDVDRRTGVISLHFGPSTPEPEDEIASWMAEVDDKPKRARRA